MAPSGAKSDCVKPIRCSRSESESEQGDELQEVDPKPGDLPMARVKLR
jgi:hypothetical protein